MCWSQQLFDAMIHVYNAGLDDYITPLIELLLQLRAALKKGKPVPGVCYFSIIIISLLLFSPEDGYLKIGYTLLVYIRSDTPNTIIFFPPFFDCP